MGPGGVIAAALARAGAAVMAGDIDEDVAKATAAAIANAGGKAGYAVLDVTDKQGWHVAVAATIAETGGFDILVNNAGVEVTGLLVDLDPADLQAMFDVNVLGEARPQACISCDAAGWSGG
ncbi:SDR family NAD(P)-dependent oxidoreductase [Fodinicola acaciae]|uniref:SDR family NAD(P)-dependent oxidoreductase n=1 Tax=Fodinicola acaciae TaxID=2681555 RepID=UPI0031B57EC4